MNMNATMRVMTKKMMKMKRSMIPVAKKPTLNKKEKLVIFHKMNLIKGIRLI